MAAAAKAAVAAAAAAAWNMATAFSIIITILFMSLPSLLLRQLLR